MSLSPQTAKSPSGARYYHSDISMWLSVDPLADKYPGLSPYMYCAGNPVVLVDLDGRKIWILGDEGQKIEYMQGMKYEGENSIIAKQVGTLNAMNETKIGSKVLSVLINSDNDFNLSNQNGCNGLPCFKANDNKEGGKGGTIYLNGNNSLEVIAHELFHAYQDELCQGGASIHNEVEAYLFADAVSLEYIYSKDGVASSAFQLSVDPDSELGKKYENSVRSLLYGINFSQDDFNNVVNLFKEHSSKNIEGNYTKLKLQKENQKQSLLSPLYPLIKN